MLTFFLKKKKKKNNLEKYMDVWMMIGISWTLGLIDVLTGMRTELIKNWADKESKFRIFAGQLQGEF